MVEIPRDVARNARMGLIYRDSSKISVSSDDLNVAYTLTMNNDLDRKQVQGLFYLLQNFDVHKTDQTRYPSEWTRYMMHGGPSAARWCAELVDHQTVNFEAIKQTDRMQVFGWLYVSERADGSTVVDHSGEHIPIDVLEKAAYKFVLSHRVMGDMHQKSDDLFLVDGAVGRKPVQFGRLIESVAFTREKIAAMGIPMGVLPLGLWVGFQVDDPTVWETIKSGGRQMFSLRGPAVIEFLGES